MIISAFYKGCCGLTELMQGIACSKASKHDAPKEKQRVACEEAVAAGLHRGSTQAESSRMSEG
jgi:hypothetical protein